MFSGLLNSGGPSTWVKTISLNKIVKEKSQFVYFVIFLFSVLLTFVTWSTVFNNNGMIFIGANQKHTCQVPADYADNQSVAIKYIAGGREVVITPTSNIFNFNDLFQQ